MKKGLFAFLIFVLAASYVGYHVFRGTGSRYDTETVLNTVYSETMDARMLFLRDETVIESNVSGALQYAVSDGTKVQKNGILARVYASDDQISVQEELSRVEGEIAGFESLSVVTELAGARPDVLSARVTAGMTELMNALRTNRSGDFESARAGMIEVLCQQQLITGEATGFEEKLAALRERKTQLVQRAVQPQSVVYAPLAGYFTGAADGYEGVLDLSSIASVSVDQLKALRPAQVPPSAIGKLSKSPVWYAVTVLSAQEARRLSTQKSISLIQPTTGLRIPVTVSAVNQNGVDGEAAVVFKGNTLDSSISALRDEPMQIEVQRYSGARVPRNAVHIEHRTRTVTDKDGNKTTEEKDVQGVYIVFGEQIKFREISPLYWGEDFVICDLSAKATFDVSMMKLYDQVVVGGKDLYDGKSIR